MADVYGRGPGWFQEAMIALFGSTIAGAGLAQAATVAAAAAQTSAALTENSGSIGGTNDGNLPSLVDPGGDSGASVIAGIRENATMINACVADITELRTQLNAEIAALKTAKLQASS